MVGGGAKQGSDSIVSRLSAQIRQADEEDESECWPDNWQTMLVFADMRSQWNAGINGVIGLRYEALPPVFEMHGIGRKRRREIFDGLRVMERAAITEINKR